MWLTAAFSTNCLCGQRGVLSTGATIHRSPCSVERHRPGCTTMPCRRTTIFQRRWVQDVPSLITTMTDGWIFFWSIVVLAIFGNRPSRFEMHSTGTIETAHSPTLPKSAGVAGSSFGMGVAVGDYDNDGWPDLFVTSYGKCTLYKNNHDGTFTDVTEKAGVASPGWTTSAVWFDYDNDGKLDLFVCSFVDYSGEHKFECGDNKIGRSLLLYPPSLQTDSKLPLSQQRRRNFYGGE